MVNYETFYDITEYASENWKGKFTPKEMAVSAYIMLCEFAQSRDSRNVTHQMRELCKLLAEDTSDQCKSWLFDIASELQIINPNWGSYQSEYDNDDWLKGFK